MTEEIREEVARVIAESELGCYTSVATITQRHYAYADALLAAGLLQPLPALSDDEFVHVGAWLLPEAYGNDYDHFTQTTMQTKPGTCVALYAKGSDLVGSPAAYRLDALRVPVEPKETQ